MLSFKVSYFKLGKIFSNFLSSSIALRSLGFSQSLYQQVPYTYTTFSSQLNLFVGSSNIFFTSTMTSPSAYNLISSMQCYHTTMPLQVSRNPSEDNQAEDNDDDSPFVPPSIISSEHDS